MCFDEVAEGLKRYRKETDVEKRLWWIERLAPTRDVRVCVALGEALGDAEVTVAGAAGLALARYYLPAAVKGDRSDRYIAAFNWWLKNKADLRQRASELPR
jgi:hypothetical protein